MIRPDDITGLVLAGGRGARMGGADKGLQPYRGAPLAQHALRRLSAQVGTLAVNANRHLDVYATFGLPVWPDGLADHPGPLAGFLAGLECCTTPYLLTVPCDAPCFPLDLAARLAQALVSQPIGGAGPNTVAIAAVAAQAGEPRRSQPVFCLMPACAAASVRDFLACGHARVMAWAREQHAIEVDFDDARAFANVNTLIELQQLGGCEAA